MISEHERFAQFRRDLERQIPYSTDPQRLREMAGVHQYSKTFTVCMLFVGTLAAYGILFACASI